MNINPNARIRPIILVRAMPNGFFTSMYAYPWDLADDGIERALDRIANLALCREVMVAVSYHISTYFLPHNPKRTIYYGEDGAVYFTPDRKRYSRTRIEPRVSEVVTGPEYLSRIVEAIRKRGLRFGAWIVYFYNHHLARKYPHLAKHDALGNPYLGQLSPAPDDVREYAVALTADVVENYGPSTVHVESLSRLPYAYGFLNPKVLSKIPPRAEFLLGLDFNPAAVSAAQSGALDAAKFRAEVAEWLRVRLARLPTADDLEPVSGAWIGEAFGGRLRLYLDAARARTTVLWNRVADVIRRGGAGIQTNPATPFTADRTDLAPSLNARINRLTVGPNEKRFAQWKSQITKDGVVMVSLQPGQFTSPGPLQEQLHRAAADGAGGATFYNYGLLREEQFGFVGYALRTL